MFYGKATGPAANLRKHRAIPPQKPPPRRGPIQWAFRGRCPKGRKYLSTIPHDLQEEIQRNREEERLEAQRQRKEVIAAKANAALEALTVKPRGKSADRSVSGGRRMTRGGSRSYSPSNRSGARRTGGSYESSKRRPRRSSSRVRANKKARGSTSPQSRERLWGRRASRSPSRERTKEKRPRGSPTRDEAPKRNESVDILRPPASHRHYYPAYHLPYAFPPYCPPPIPSYYQPPFLPQPSSHLQSPLIPSYPFPPQQNEAVYWQNTIQYADGLKKHAENQLAVVEKKKPEVNGEKEVIPFRKKIFVITLDDKPPAAAAPAILAIEGAPPAPVQPLERPSLPPVSQNPASDGMDLLANESAENEDLMITLVIS